MEAIKDFCNNESQFNAVRSARYSARTRNMKLTGAPIVGRSYVLERLKILYVLNGNLRVLLNHRVGLFVCATTKHKAHKVPKLHVHYSGLCSTIGRKIAYKRFAILSKTLNSKKKKHPSLFSSIF
jgi:hypothetical protein